MTPTLWDSLNSDESKLEAEFQQFHAAHPEVYDKLRELALDLVHHGHRAHLGMKMLWETLRYYSLLGARPDEDVYRLNNNHTSRYARMLMEREPELRDVFETRQLRAAS